MQSLALSISVILIVGLLGCYLWVLRNSGSEVDLSEISPSAYRLRGKLFLFIAVVGLLLTFVSLTPWPHSVQASEVTRHIDVKSRQWAWDLSDTTVRVGEVIEFRVTSEDVTHGFGLYNSEKKVVAQIQAMPGFVNKARYKFEKAGTYDILCLEYCGLAHHGMVAQITAVDEPAR